jgi:hypothetical protein
MLRVPDRSDKSCSDGLDFLTHLGAGFWVAAMAGTDFLCLESANFRRHAFPVEDFQLFVTMPQGIS